MKHNFKNIIWKISTSRKLKKIEIFENFFFARQVAARLLGATSWRLACNQHFFRSAQF